MACQVEMMNGNGSLNDRESSPENESDIEIMTLKQTLKDKLHNENVNGGLNSNGEAASSSNNSFNGIGAVENGHTNDKGSTDSEMENDNIVVERLTPKRGKGKIAKGKKEKSATPKSKRRTPVKKVAHEEELTVSEQSWESIELASKDIEDDASTIDVVGDNDDSAVIIEEGECSAQEMDLEARTEPLYEKPKDADGPSVFSRLRDSMRFSISPQKQEPTTSSFNTADKEVKSFRSLSGRRALHQTPPRYNFKENEFVAQKRKADTEDPDEPRQKYFMTSLSDRSPGWKLFSTPFQRFWSPKKYDVNTSASSSTPLRKLHEDLRDDSMTVNVNDSLNISLQDEEDMNIENEEKIQDLEKTQVKDKMEKSTAQTSWKCSIM